MVLYFLLCCVLTAVGFTYVRNTGEVSSPKHKENDGEEFDDQGTLSISMSIPFKPLTLSFRDLCYEVNASTSKQKLMLLKNVNGIFRPGRMCALMGSSGAGYVFRILCRFLSVGTNLFGTVCVRGIHSKTTLMVSFIGLAPSYQPLHY